MPRIYLQSQTTAARRRFPVFLVDVTDGLTPETGENGGQPQLSKNGGSFANTSATLVAVGNGHYYVELTALELDTLGYIVVRFKSANTAEFNMDGQVSTLDLATAIAQTGDSFARIGAAGASLTAVPWNSAWDAEVQSEVADAMNVAIPGSPTADSINERIKAIDDKMPAGAISELTAAQVNAEVVDALNVDTYAEPVQGAPAATTTLVNKIGFLYKFLRNRVTQSSTETKVYADNTTTVDHKATVSDSGTVFTREEFVSGP